MAIAHTGADAPEDPFQDPRPWETAAAHDYFYRHPHFRTFDSGAIRDTDQDKPRYGGFISPAVWAVFGEYMHKNRKMADGTLRAADNWQKGIPVEEYIESLLRHVMDVWLWLRGNPEFTEGGYEEALCAVLFNAQGLLFEYLVETGAIER